jgi:hypothetical protein
MIGSFFCFNIWNNENSRIGTIKIILIIIGFVFYKMVYILNIVCLHTLSLILLCLFVFMTRNNSLTI